MTARFLLPAGKAFLPETAHDDDHHRRPHPHRRGRARVARPDAAGLRAEAVLDDGARQSLVAARDYIDAHFMTDDAPLM